MMKFNHFLYILKFLHFYSIGIKPAKTDKNYDRFWKVKSFFDMVSDTYDKIYIPSEHLAVGEVIVLFKGSCFQASQS